MISDVHALSLEQILDKERQDFSRDDLVKAVEQRGIDKLTFHYTALDGKLKELKIPLADRSRAEHVLADGERVDGSSLFKGMVDPSLSDLYVVPVYKSAFLSPFDPRSLDVICRYVTSDGRLAPFAPDTILQRAAKLFRQRTSLELHAHGELEFFLFMNDHSPLYRPGPQRGYHASTPFLKSGHILDEMVRHIATITGAVKYSHAEVGVIDKMQSDVEEINGKQGEQLEVEFLPVPIEDAGDHLVLARWIIRTIACRHGCVATFAPKLEEGVAGNGMHVHMELIREGKSMMTEDSGELSLCARKVIGGLCNYAGSLTAFGNTVASAYLRLVPDQEAPTDVFWSDRNRSAMIRVPLGWTHHDNLALLCNPQAGRGNPARGHQTVELRSPDGSANVHLLLAGITLAAEWGLTHDESQRIARMLYSSGNGVLNTDRPVFPRSCAESARMLLQSRRCYERDDVFSPSVIDYVARLLQAEDDEGMNGALAALPDGERAAQARRTMHRALHRH